MSLTSAAFWFLLQHKDPKYWQQILRHSEVAHAIRNSPWHSDPCSGLILRATEDVLVFKKVRTDARSLPVRIVVPLMIPQGALMRIDLYSKKCRTNLAVFDGTRVYKEFGELKYHKLPEYARTFSDYDHSFTYTPGPVTPRESQEEVIAEMKETGECGTGIHFFFDFDSANAW